MLIAQERLATNHVYVFSKATPSGQQLLAEIRSQAEKGSKLASTLQIKMSNGKTVTIHACNIRVKQGPNGACHMTGR